MSPQFRAATVQPWQAQRGQDHPRVLLWGGGTRKAQGLLLQGEMEPWACGLPEHSFSCATSSSLFPRLPYTGVLMCYVRVLSSGRILPCCTSSSVRWQVTKRHTVLSF